MVLDLIIIPLSYIINVLTVNGEYTDLLKLPKVLPIHNGESTQDVNIYQPISLLSIFNKIIEKLLHKRQYTFLQINNILFCNQLMI